MHNAYISLDLDNKWSYLKTHGNRSWQQYPSYLHTLIPVTIDYLSRHDLTMTYFVVGIDASHDCNQDSLRLLSLNNHDVGNHSYHHEPWLHTYSHEKLHDELHDAHNVILDATGLEPIGFRGPGFSSSSQLISVLASLNYLYDASTFPTFLGPLARMYYFSQANLSQEDKQLRSKLFGRFDAGLLPLTPYRWHDSKFGLLEIPVSTMPVLRFPIHISYLLYMATFSQRVAIEYFRSVLLSFRFFRIEPTILYHPLDFIGSDLEPDLNFFPCMNRSTKWKLTFLDRITLLLKSFFQVQSLNSLALKLHDSTLPTLPTMILDK